MDRALREWLERYIEARLIRVQRGNDFTQELIRRSHKQIAISRDLLSREVPKVWAPGAASNGAVRSWPDSGGVQLESTLGLEG